MRRFQPSRYTTSVIRFLNTLMHIEVDPAVGFSTICSGHESMQDAMEPARDEWQETAAMTHDINPHGYAHEGGV